MKHTKLLGTGNTKLNKTGKTLGVKIVNFSLPRYQSVTGKITCPFAKDCIKFCYAGKGSYRYPSVQLGLERRLEASKQRSFIDDISTQLRGFKTDKQVYVRIHDSGDFYSPDYIFKWNMIALNNPDVRFYAYTKSKPLFDKLPYNIADNFDLIYSEGSKRDDLINTEVDRHARIFASEAELLEAGYTDCSSNDLHATKWYNANNKIGLVFH